jgi:hypothetical protein
MLREELPGDYSSLPDGFRLGCPFTPNWLSRYCTWQAPLAGLAYLSKWSQLPSKVDEVQAAPSVLEAVEAS